jgi:hypothetical protein
LKHSFEDVANGVLDEEHFDTGMSVAHQ